MKERFFLFAGDQKIEHLNKNFFGNGLPEVCADPEYLFKVATKVKASAFATQLGLVELYGTDYKDINYLIKLNSKTNLVPTEQRDPVSLALHSVDDVVRFKHDSGLSVVGVGYTVYLGSEYESQMLTEAAQIVYEAHLNDLIAVLWMYPRGKAVKDELDPGLIAGAAGVAACLGADFVKINCPREITALKQAVLAAGRTGVLCSGGAKKDEALFLKELEEQIALGAVGCAAGRNVYQKTEDDAVQFCEKVKKIIFG